MNNHTSEYFCRYCRSEGPERTTVECYQCGRPEDSDCPCLVLCRECERSYAAAAECVVRPVHTALVFDGDGPP